MNASFQESSTVRLPRIGASVFLGAFGIVVAVFFLELLVRFIPEAPEVRADKDRPKEFYIPSGATSLRGNLDSSLRSRDYTVAVVGDSFTFAPKMQPVDAFPARLERLLDLNAANRSVDVLNFGTPGYSTFLETTAVREALKLNPNLVMLQITLNDPQRYPLNNHEGVFDLEHSGGMSRRVFDSVLGWSKAYRLVRNRLLNARSVRSYIEYHQQLFDDPTTWTGFRDSVAIIDGDARKAGVPLVAVLFPLFDFPIDESYPFRAAHEKIRAYMKERGIPILDLTSAYVGIQPTRLQLVPGRDSHPNEIAHRIAAEEIYRWLRRRALLPRELFSAEVYSRRETVRQGLDTRESKKHPH